MSGAAREPIPPQPADLEIRVTTPWGRDGDRLHYTLQSPTGVAGFHARELEGRPVKQADRFQRQIMEQLELLDKGLDIEGHELHHQEIEEELISIGHWLYRQLWPAELRSLFRAVRPRIQSLLVVSDEPWIPWEMLHPAEEENDDFLCMQLSMSRWLTGEAPLSYQKSIQRFLSLSLPGDPRAPALKAGTTEGDILTHLRDTLPDLAGDALSDIDLYQLREHLREADFDLLHLAGHGKHDAQRPSEASIDVSFQRFRARHISGAIATNLARNRPFVFFNTCQSGRLGEGLSGMGGWAETWIRQCHGTAYLAPIWAVRDSQAKRFAELVYGQLAARTPLGEAVLRARTVLREEHPGSTAWLAYCLYGAPTARVEFGAGPFASHGNRATHPPRQQRPPAAEPRPSLARKRTSSRARAASLALLGATAFGLTLWMASSVSRIGEPDQPSADNQETAAPSQHEELSTLSQHKEPEETVVESPPDDPPEEKPSVDRAEAQKAAASLPHELPIPGRVAVVVLDGRSRQSDRNLVEAIRAVLADESPTVSTLAPSPPLTAVESLLQGDLSAIPDTGWVPWGAPYLLLATATHEPIPQASAHIKAVSLHLDVQMISTLDRTIAVRASSSHTGMGISTSAALQQAASRCLRKVTDLLD
ncbi:MAG: CHAT domain-containing protein [Acidobacteriota bacterium]